MVRIFGFLGRKTRHAVDIQCRQHSSTTKVISPAPVLNRPVLKLVSSWFCPFAQRAWIALNHRGIAYEWIEALDWHADGSYKKSHILLEHNPQGLVPTIIGQLGSRQVVTESLLCLEFADDFAAAYPDSDPANGNAPLLPLDPWELSKVRERCDWVNKKLCSPYYTILVRPEWEVRRAAFEELLNSLREFSAHCETSPGPFFLSGGNLGAVDIALIPWACRYYALDHYRSGFGHGDFRIPKDDPSLAAFHRWCEASFSLPSVESTIPDHQRYIDHVVKYADGSAQSKVGDAVRAGRPAHELKID